MNAEDKTREGLCSDEAKPRSILSSEKLDTQTAQTTQNHNWHLRRAVPAKSSSPVGHSKRLIETETLSLTLTDRTAFV